MKYKQTKNGVEGFSETFFFKNLPPHFFICLKKKNMFRKAGTFWTNFSDQHLGKKTHTKNLVFIWTLNIIQLLTIEALDMM